MNWKSFNKPIPESTPPGIFNVRKYLQGKRMSETTVRFKSLRDDFKMPTYATPGAAGFDMRACIDNSVVLMPSERQAISLGCAVEIPEGFEIQVRPRSGLALKEGVTVINTPGTIDSDYRGECKVLLINHGTQPVTINPQDRVCQFVVQSVPKVKLVQVADVSETERGTGGFGSTGKQ